MAESHETTLSTNKSRLNFGRGPTAERTTHLAMEEKTGSRTKVTTVLAVVKGGDGEMGRRRKEGNGGKGGADPYLHRGSGDRGGGIGMACKVCIRQMNSLLVKMAKNEASGAKPMGSRPEN